MFALASALTPRRHPGSERGAAAVEFALVIPMLLLLLFGIVDLGRLYASNMAFTAATREAARAVAIAGINPNATVQAAVNATIAQGFTAAGLESSRVTVTSVTWCATTTSIATVQARYRYQFITPASALVGIFMPGAASWGTARGMTHTAWFRCS